MCRACPAKLEYWDTERAKQVNKRGVGDTRYGSSRRPAGDRSTNRAAPGVNFPLRYVLAAIACSVLLLAAPLPALLRIQQHLVRFNNTLALGPDILIKY